MKCQHCPKEIREDRAFERKVKGTIFITNPDYDRHMKIHIKKTK